MDQDYLYKHLLDLAKASRFRECAKYSRFLNPAQAALSKRAAKEAGTVVSLYGGYEDAEYRIARFCADETEDAWPITALKATWNVKYGDVGHRDLLGAVMGLSISRDLMGDIVLLTGAAFIFFVDDTAGFIAENLTDAGRVKLSISPADPGEEMPPPKGVIIRDTVSSLRLDAIVAAIFNLPRERAKQMVGRGEVRVNHVETQRPDEKIDAGDLISVRGYGRFKLVEILGETKKGRIAARFFRFGT